VTPHGGSFAALSVADHGPTGTSTGPVGARMAPMSDPGPRDDLQDDAQEPDQREPDYRMSLAAERTYLAYVRTSLAMLAAGVAVVGALPDAGHEELRRAMGIILILVGTLVAVTARMRWRAVDNAMRRGRPLPPSRTSLPIEAGIIVAAALALLLVLLV
jgi:putative membrane protein